MTRPAHPVCNGFLVAYLGLSSLVATLGMNFLWRGLIQREMGLNVKLVKLSAFAFVGLAAGFAGVLAILINTNCYPTVGDGYLLSVLAAVFVGGTPTWGGVGTIAGSGVGAFTVGSIETGIVAAGLTGYFTQFFYCVVIVLSLVTHRLTRPRTKVGGRW